jgi:hypothetical protein
VSIKITPAFDPFNCKLFHSFGSIIEVIRFNNNSVFPVPSDPMEGSVLSFLKAE